MRTSSAASLLLAAASLAASPALHAAASVIKGHGDADQGFKLDPVSPPATNDAATKAVFTLVDGEKDRNSAELAVLADGKVPTGDDQPTANFFFAQGSEGGRIAVDLGEITPVKSVGSYSWHGGARGPQVYKLYAASGTEKDFNAAPKRGTDPKSVGWDLVAEVDTRSKDGKGGGQHGVEIGNPGSKPLGDYRYLLFDVDSTTKGDPFGNTFFSEVDVISAKDQIERLKVAEKIVKEYKSKDGKFRYIINSTKAPDLTEWSDKELAPVIQEWYPKLVELMPSQGYKAPDVVTFEFLPGINVPAYAAGNKITLNAGWFAKELKREAKGATVHEMGHVVQNYWRARQTNRNPKDTPGWVTEGVCDYLRWFLYEPQSRGAGLGPDRADKVSYSDSYRTTGNFLDWVVTEKDKELMQKLNAAGREGKYEEALWKEWTGKTLQELNIEWKEAIKAGKRVQK